ncbi:pentatricopeptide repeat-containing protein [Trifolium repens]|nr:pentatricopeptide repeat-containing protein [Trifolium repens]
MIRVYKLHATLIKTGQHQNPLSLRSFFLNCSESSATARYAASVLLSFPIPPDPFSYNTVIRHVSPHSPTLALSLFSHMHRNSVPFDHFTFPLILKHHHNHQSLHSLILKLGFDSNIFVQNALINAYGCDGSLHVAVKLFDEMRQRDIVSWSTLISCLANNNLPAEALSVFQQMQLDQPDIVSSLDGVIMLSVISAISSLGVLELGIWVHCFISRIRLSMTVPLGTALINMYSRCGSIDRSVKVFDEMRNRSVVTWTGLINGLAVHGRRREALKAFYDMKESGLMPDGTSFIAALDAGFLKA